MKLKDKILEVKKIFENKEFNILSTEECIKGINKKETSRAHFNRIISNDACVLIVNENKII